MNTIMNYKNTQVRVAIADNDVWFSRNDIAKLVGQRNPNQMLHGLRDVADERKIPSHDARGRSTAIIHLPSQIVLLLIDRSKVDDKDDLRTWITETIEQMTKQATSISASKRADVLPVAPVSAQPKMAKKLKAKAYAIKADDFAQLAGKSTSTIYAWVKEERLPKIDFLKKFSIGMDNYYLVTERDMAYEIISNGLENDANEYGIVLDVRIEIVGKTTC